MPVADVAESAAADGCVASAAAPAPVELQHWVLVAPLQDGLLPFRRLRLTTSELHTTALPARRILLMENERSLHQLPTP